MPSIKDRLLGALAGLIEYKGRTARPLPFHQAGRVVLRGGFRASWSFGKLEGPHFSITTCDDDRDVTLGLGGPLVMLRLSCPDRRERIRKLAQRLARVDYRYEDVDIIRVYIYHGVLYWNFLHSTHQWKCTDPWWSQWSFDPVDRMFGRAERIDKPQGDEIVELGFPEGTYRWRIKTAITTIRRPRWPWVWGEPFTTYDARPVGENDDIPIPGKGENSWDCGPDSLSGQSGPGGLTEAIGSIYASVLRTRLQRCGSAEYAERPRPRKTACPRCDGKGRVPFDLADYDPDPNDFVPRTKPCPECSPADIEVAANELPSMDGETVVS